MPCPRSKPKSNQKLQTPAPSASQPAQASNPRIFNPRAYLPTCLFQTPSELSLPREITLYDPETALTNLLFRGVSTKRGIIVISKVAESRENEVVVCVAGKYDANVTARDVGVAKEEVDGNGGRAAYGVFFGPSSTFNASGILSSTMPQTTIAAELEAVRVALQRFRQNILVERSQTEKLVIMTYSEQVANGLTRDVWKWEENRYKTSRGKKVVNEGAFRQIHDLVLGLEREGVSVEFWKVDRCEDKGAVALVCKTLDEGNALRGRGRGVGEDKEKGDEMEVQDGSNALTEKPQADVDEETHQDRC